MKNITYWILSVIGVLFWNSCTKEVSEIKQEGNPILQIESQLSNAHFGDELPFTVMVSDDDVSLSTLTAILYFGEEEVERTTIRTKENGEYYGTISIPFLKDIPDGTATLTFILKNTTLKTTTQSFDITINRPSYPYIILVTENGSYPMLPTGQPNEYAVTEAFPSTDLPAYIKTPVVDDKGREILFGWEAGTITQDVLENIPFVSPKGGAYTVSFNTKTYEATPFFEILINDQKMMMIDKENYEIDLDLSNGQGLIIEGLDKLDEWWIDKDFFTEKEVGTYKFTPITGKYKITANLPLKYFRVEVLDGSSPATLKDDGTGAIWLIGNNVGKPSIEELEVGWEPSRALCMAPIDDKKYQLTLIAGESINAETIDFKFFHQKDWGDELSSELLTTDSDIVFIGDGENGRDNGNLGLVPETSLEVGAIYKFTIDLSNGNQNALLNVSKQ